LPAPPLPQKTQNNGLGIGLCAALSDCSFMAWLFSLLTALALAAYGQRERLGGLLENLQGRFVERQASTKRYSVPQQGGSKGTRPLSGSRAAPLYKAQARHVTRARCVAPAQTELEQAKAVSALEAHTKPAYPACGVRCFAATKAKARTRGQRAPNQPLLLLLLAGSAKASRQTLNRFCF